MENRNNIEFWIFDEKLINIAKENDQEALKQMMHLHPEQCEVIENAFLLLQNMKVEEAVVSDLQVERSLKGFWDRVDRRKNRRRLYWISTACAACISVILVVSSLLLIGRDYVDNKEEVLALLDSIQSTSNEILIISGGLRTTIPNNEVINQTAQGDFVVGTEKKMKFSDLQGEMIQLVVPVGKRTAIRFNDGTVAWLNAGSKLLYPKTFLEDRRDIYIEGETYLEVEKDQSRPFFVHTKDFDVSVLGTKFNVSAYKEDLQKSVVLVEGSVEVGSDNNKYKLIPKEGFFYAKNSSVVKKVDTYAYTCWKDGIMQIQNEPLEHIFTRLEKYYGVKIIFDSSVSKKKYIGNLNLYDSISEVLHNLSHSTPFTFEYNKETNVVKVYQKKKRYSK